MNTGKNNKVFLLILSTVSLVIWGMIGHQIIWGVTFEAAQDEQLPEIASISEKKTRVHDDDFLANVQFLRDPFRERVITQKRPIKVKQTAKNKKSIELPELSFVGLLGDDSGQLAIISDKTGATHLCRIGDEVSGARVQNIEKSSVQMEFEGQAFAIRLK